MVYTTVIYPYCAFFKKIAYFFLLVFIHNLIIAHCMLCEPCKGYVVNEELTNISPISYHAIDILFLLTVCMCLSLYGVFVCVAYLCVVCLCVDHVMFLTVFGLAQL